MNAAFGPNAQAKWELSIAANWLCFNNNVSGQKLQWKFKKENGAYIQDGKKEINWWQYCIVILELLPIQIFQLY